MRAFASVRPVFFIASLFFIVASLPAGAAGQSSAWKSADYLQVRLISGISAIGQREKILAGLELRLAEGWHAYWRMPGNSGLPPRLDWSDAENVAAVDIMWPLPARLEVSGLQNFIYKKSVLLPLEITLKEAGTPVALALEAEIMVCRDICVPQTVALSLDVPAGPAEPGRYGAVLDRALAKVPQRESSPSLRIENAVAGPEALAVTVWTRDGFEKADLFVETGDKDITITAPPEIIDLGGDPRRAILKIPAPEGMENLAKAVIGKTLILTLTDGRTAIEKEISF